MKKLNFKFQNFQKGFIAIYLSIIVLVLVFGISISLSLFFLNQQKILSNITSSTQAYYLAEGGIEDALIRLRKGLNPREYSLSFGKGNAFVYISEIIGGSRTITAKGVFLNRIRKIQAVYKISSQKISFFYGAQIGEGGMTMGNNSRVAGNVYSNASVISGRKGYIDGSIIVAKNGNRIEGLEVLQNAKVHSCIKSIIKGTLTYVSGGNIQNCPSGLVKTQPNEIPAIPLPISEEQINNWKTEAQKGGEIVGNYIISGKTTMTLGPLKITGNLIVENEATLNMRGTIWVLGNLIIQNGARIKLDHSYGPTSGIIIVDGKTKVKPTTFLVGSGQEGSYLMILSTNPEVSNIKDPAIEVDNNADSAIFYASNGLIVLRNNVKVREVVGYKVFLDNNAEILYESGLENTLFASGPGGSWDVVSWQEVE